MGQNQLIKTTPTCTKNYYIQTGIFILVPQYDNEDNRLILKYKDEKDSNNTADLSTFSYVQLLVEATQFACFLHVQVTIQSRLMELDAVRALKLKTISFQK